MEIDQEKLAEARKNVTVRQFIEECNLHIKPKLIGTFIKDYSNDLHVPLQGALNPYTMNFGFKYGVWHMKLTMESDDYMDLSFSSITYNFFDYTHTIKKDRRYKGNQGTVTDCEIVLSKDINDICTLDDTLEQMIYKCELRFIKNAYSGIEVENFNLENKIQANKDEMARLSKKALNIKAKLNE